MIKIRASFIKEKTLITLDDDGVLLINSKDDVMKEIITSAYLHALKSYGPECGFFGKYLAMELAKHGAKISKVSDTEEDEAKEGTVW